MKTTFLATALAAFSLTTAMPAMADVKIGILNDQSGVYAERWKREHADGLRWFQSERARRRDHPIEQVGARLRAAMPFLEPSRVPEDQPQPAGAR